MIITTPPPLPFYYSVCKNVKSPGGGGKVQFSCTDLKKKEKLSNFFVFTYQTPSNTNFNHYYELYKLDEE